MTKRQHNIEARGHCQDQDLPGGPPPQNRPTVFEWSPDLKFEVKAGESSVRPYFRTGPISELERRDL
jgi:hypothetical protein